MRSFLENNRDELIARCKVKVALRPARNATATQLANGVPLFLEQLTRTLAAEGDGDASGSLRISGPSGGDASLLSEMGVTAAAHGKALLGLGFTIDQVVHDYGDLCQAITDLAVERDAPFSVDSFRTLNRCLDNAIADAVTEFASQRDLVVAHEQSQEENERLGFLVHELRNYLQVAKLSFAALESGQLPVSGSTGGVLKRSLQSLETLLKHSLDTVRETARTADQRQVFSLALFLAEAVKIGALYAGGTGCTLRVPNVDPSLGLRGSRELLSAALGNLLQNAFKFTEPRSEIILHGYASGDRVLIDVQDHCGGLAPGSEATLFQPFKQSVEDKRGLGLGLSIARQSVEADGGRLSVRDIPGSGCVFTIDLPLAPLD